jgi:hypothetical protein
MAFRKRAPQQAAGGEAPPAPPPPPATSASEANWFSPYLDLPGARSALASTRAGEPEPLHELLAAVGSPAEQEALVSALGGEQLGEVLDRWVDRHGTSSPIPWCVRGHTRVRAGWALRGSAKASEVDERAWDGFFEHLRAAERDFQEAARRAPSAALPWTGLILTARALEIPKAELRARCQRASRDAALLPQAAEHALQGLCAKWGGSDEEMFAFARTTSDAAPDGDPVHRIVPLAWSEWAARHGDDAYLSRGDAARQEIEATARRCLERPELLEGLVGRQTVDAFAVVAGDFDLHDLARWCLERNDGRYSDWWNGFFDDPTASVRYRRRKVGLSS